jgi:hypothetical protein
MRTLVRAEFLAAPVQSTNKPSKRSSSTPLALVCESEILRLVGRTITFSHANCFAHHQVTSALAYEVIYNLTTLFHDHVMGAIAMFM